MPTLLGRLKQGATFINTARAEVVDHDALVGCRARPRPSRGARRLSGRADGGDWRLFAIRSARSCRASTGPITSARPPSRRRRPSPPRPCASSASFKDTGQVPNVVNLARRTPATHRLIVRHRDRPGVLAHVFDHLRGAAINVQETENIDFRRRRRPPSPASTSTARPATRCWPPSSRPPRHPQRAARHI